MSKRGAKRLSRAQETEFRRYREAGVSHKHCCEMFDISRAKGFRVMAKLRELMGPETLRNGQLARHPLRPANQQVSRENETNI